MDCPAPLLRDLFRRWVDGSSRLYRFSLHAHQCQVYVVLGRPMSRCGLLSVGFDTESTGTHVNTTQEKILRKKIGET
jgi:hypothetical protein